jgi:transcriptional regulator with XRE-family HTH domain
LTQALIAREFDINQLFLSKLEKGRQEPNFLLVEVLARDYGVKLSAFFAVFARRTRHGHHLND